MSKILLAEDDDAIRHYLATALRRAGHDVIACANGLDGAEALDKAAAGPALDLLVTDIVMPGLDGMELAARARRQIPGIKVLFLTGFAAMAADFPRDAGDKTPIVISKPVHLGRLVEQIAALLEGRESLK